MDAKRDCRYISNAAELETGALCLQFVAMHDTQIYDKRPSHAPKLRAVTVRAAAGPTHIACCLVVLLSVATVKSATAGTPIYKCFDRKSDVVYTDQPCKDGALLDVRAGDADPAAVARLERARDSLDQSAAERIRDLRLMAVQPAFGYPGPSGQGSPDYSPYDYGPMLGLSGVGISVFGNGRPQHGRPRAGFNARGFAVMGPNAGGRR